MPVKIVQAVVAILLFGAACSGSRNSDVPMDLPNVESVTYRETSGAVSPDSAWSELYTVSSDGLTFVRTGYSELTTVNTGTWTINSYGSKEAKLFSDLSTADVFWVVKTGEGAVAAGSGIKDYTIRYANGGTKEVIIGDGSMYNNAGLITAPTDSYVSSVVLPADASNRYK